MSFCHAFDRLLLFTAVLGIGERVGITPLGGLAACLYAANHAEYVKSKYNLTMLVRQKTWLPRQLRSMRTVHESYHVCPFPYVYLVRLTAHVFRGYCTFTHKAGYSRQGYP